MEKEGAAIFSRWRNQSLNSTFQVILTTHVPADAVLQLVFGEQIHKA
jgi:hypothetical protein